MSEISARAALRGSIADYLRDLRLKKAARGADEIQMEPPREVRKVSTLRRDFETVAPASSEIVSGVIAAAISSNSLQPVAVGPAAWDIMSCKHAIIEANLTSIRLPDPSFTIAQYATMLENVEFDAQCAAPLPNDPRTPSRQQLMNVATARNYVIQAVAIVESQAALDALLTVAGIAPADLKWCGPWSQAESFLFSHTLRAHTFTFSGTQYSFSHAPSTIDVEPPPAHVFDEDTATAPGRIDMTFIAVDGGAWQVHASRIA